MASKMVAFVIAFVAMAVTASSATGQGVFDMGSLTASLSVDHVTQSERARARGAPSLGASTTRLVRRPITATTNAVNLAILNYAPSLVRRRENMARFVELQRSANPAESDGLQRMIVDNDFIVTIAPELAKSGLRINNVADAYTLWWVSAWQAASGNTAEVSRSTYMAVSRQAARALIDTQMYGTASDSIKQELAEIFLVQGAIWNAAVNQGKNDPAAMKKLGVAIRRQARGADVDLDAMTLTERGFVPSGKTGEADPAPGEAPKALAAVDSAPGTPVLASQPPYILIAAAGGAGLGGVFLLGKMMGRRG